MQKYVMPLRFVKKDKVVTMSSHNKLSRSNTFKISSKLVRVENSKSESFGICKIRVHLFITVHDCSRDKLQNLKNLISSYFERGSRDVRLQTCQFIKANLQSNSRKHAPNSEFVIPFFLSINRAIKSAQVALLENQAVILPNQSTRFSNNI